MTKEEFEKIIMPLSLLNKVESEFMITALKGNFDKYNKTKVENLGLGDVRHLACDKCKRSLSANIKEGECIICNTKI